jgi:minor extracellular serine protease Vpr
VLRALPDLRCAVRKALRPASGVVLVTACLLAGVPAGATGSATTDTGDGTSQVRMLSTSGTGPTSLTSLPALVLEPSEPWQQLINLQRAFTLAGIDPTRAGYGVAIGVIDSGIAVFPADGSLEPEERSASDEIFYQIFGDFPAAWTLPGLGYATNACFSDAGLVERTQFGDLRYTNNKVIAARMVNELGTILRSDARAVLDHGSHVAGLAACNAGTLAHLGGTSDGRRPAGTMSGVAPGALLGSYNVFPSMVDSWGGPAEEDIARAVDLAVADGMKVINLSLGMGTPTGSLAKSIQAANKAGVLVIAAAGNEGPGPNTVSYPAILPNVIAVAATSSGVRYSAAASIGQLTVAAEEGTHLGPRVPVTATAALTSGRGVLGLSNACASSEVTQVTGDVMVVSRGVCNFTVKVEVAKAAGASALVVINNSDESVAMDLALSAGTDLPTVMVSRTAGEALVAKARSTGASAQITVQPSAPRADKAGQLEWFSSRGPVRGSTTKPDLSAPGGNLLSAAVDQMDTQCFSECFRALSGTSMAAPIVAGAAAVLWSARPSWSMPMVRSALVHTANPSRVKVGDKRAPVSSAGTGMLDLAAAISARIGVGQVSLHARAGTTRTRVLTVLNPGTKAVRVAITRVNSGGTRIKAPTSVLVPAKGSASVRVSVTAGKLGQVATLVLTGAKTTLRVLVAPTAPTTDIFQDDWVSSRTRVIS